MDIVEEIRNDREKGARRLESEYRNGLRTLALRFCDDPGDADELVNRTFAEVVANIDNYAEQSAFFGWMCKILVHLHSKDVRRKEHDGIVYPGTLPDIADADAEEAIFRNLDASLLRDAIETLPADIRKTLLLHYFMEMPVKDVARFLAIPSGTVMWRLHYARQMLAAKLGAVSKKPGVKTLLIALAIGATAALGAAVVAIAGARQQAYDSNEAGQQADNGKEADEPFAPRQDADVGGMADTSASPIGDIGDIGNTAGSGDSPPTIQTPTTQEPTMKSTSLLLATPLAALPLVADPADYTWMSSPASANWDTTSLNWNSGEAWSDGNNAIFPASTSSKTITLSAARTANNVTVNGTGYTFTGGKLMTVAGKFSVPFTASGQTCTLADGFGGDSAHIGGNSVGTIYMGWAGAPTVKTTYLEDTVVIAPNDRRCFGPDPSAPSTNIVAAGPSPSLYANGNINLAPNRIMRVASGAGVHLGAANGKTLTFGPVAADPSPGLDFSTNTFVSIPSYWGGAVVFNPGADSTNVLGRLLVKRNLKLASGVTRIGSAVFLGTGDNAALHVQGNGSAFDPARGLLVDGARLEIPQTGRYVDVNKCGQVTVTNGGAVVATGVSVEWLNGLATPGRLTVVDGGDFTVNILRVSQAGGSEIHLDEGGTIRAAHLKMDATARGLFAFDGGTFQSRASGDGRDLFSGSAANWANVTFSVGAKGANFDTSNGQNIWWDYPLTSGAATDGGVTKTGSALLIFRTANNYNGPTAVEAGGVQARADNAIPVGSTLRLGGGTATFDAHTYETESPQRETSQSIGRVEGSGVLYHMAESHVTGAVAPSVGGSLTFAEFCDFQCDYEIRGNDTGCGSLVLRGAGQDISGITLQAGDMAAMDMHAPRGTYPILSAPNGYTGRFSVGAGFPSDKWDVRYSPNAALLVPVNAFVLVVR